MVMVQIRTPQLHDQLIKHDEIVPVIKEYKEWYGDKEILEKIEYASQETMRWLQQNRQSYDDSYSLKMRQPWWPEGLVPTDDPVLLEIRSAMLRFRIYEHGILKMINTLIDEDVMEEVSDTMLDTVVDAATTTVITQLVGFKHSPDKSQRNRTESLSELKKLFGFAETTKSNRLRNKFLVQLTGMGILTARYDQGYAISIGPVGHAFYQKVYVPIITEFSR
jgi:hypothetical protein